MAEPGYLRVAEAIRRLIMSGELRPGDKLPSRERLAAEYGGTPSNVRDALRLLAGEGLVVLAKGQAPVVAGQPGRQILNLDVLPAPSTFEAVSAPIPAPAGVARRLGIAVGDAVMRTLYRHMDEGRRTVRLTSSWEPLAVTGTRLESVPEVGEHRGRGVAARMALIGVTVVRRELRVLWRPASHEEARELGLPPGAPVGVVQRTHVDDSGRPVETADVVVPADRWEIAYEVPVARPEA